MGRHSAFISEERGRGGRAAALAAAVPGRRSFGVQKCAASLPPPASSDVSARRVLRRWGRMRSCSPSRLGDVSDMCVRVALVFLFSLNMCVCGSAVGLQRCRWIAWWSSDTHA